MATFRAGFKILSEISKKQGRGELSQFRSVSEDRSPEKWKPEDQWSPRLPSSSCEKPKQTKSWLSLFRSSKEPPCDYRRSNCPLPEPKKFEPFFSFKQEEKPPLFMCRLEQERRRLAKENNLLTCEEMKEEPKWPEPPKECYVKPEPKPAPTAPFLPPKENGLKLCPYLVHVDHPKAGACPDTRLPYSEFKPKRSWKASPFSLKKEEPTTCPSPPLKNLGRVPFSEFKTVELPRPLYTRYKDCELKDSSRLFAMLQLKCPSTEGDQSPSLALQPPAAQKPPPKQGAAKPSIATSSFTRIISCATRLKNAPAPPPFVPKPTKLVEKPRFRNPCADNKKCSLRGIQPPKQEDLQLMYKPTKQPDRVLTGALTDEPLSFQRYTPSTKPPDWMFRISKPGSKDTPLVPCNDQRPKEPDWCGETDGLKFYDGNDYLLNPRPRPAPCNRVANEPLKLTAPCPAKPKERIIERFVIMPERYHIHNARPPPCKPELDPPECKQCFQDFIIAEAKKREFKSPNCPRKETIYFDLCRCCGPPKDVTQKCYVPPPPSPCPPINVCKRHLSTCSLPTVNCLKNNNILTFSNVLLSQTKGDALVSSLQHQVREQSCGKKPPNQSEPCRRPRPKPPKPPKCDLLARKRPNCAEAVMPCCPPAVIPPDCDLVKQRVPCKKVLAPRPAYSECRKDPPRPQRITECNCWDEDPICHDDKPSSGPPLPRCSKVSSTQEEKSEESNQSFNFGEISQDACRSKSASSLNEADKVRTPWPSYSDVLKESLQPEILTTSRRSMSTHSIRTYAKASKFQGVKSCNREKCPKETEDPCNQKIDKGPKKTWVDCPEPCDEECPPPCEIIEPVDLPGCQDPCKEEVKKSPCIKKDPCGDNKKKASGVSSAGLPQLVEFDLFYDAFCEPPIPPSPAKTVKPPKNQRDCDRNKDKQIGANFFDEKVVRNSRLLYKVQLNSQKSNTSGPTVHLKRGMATSVQDKDSTRKDHIPIPPAISEPCKKTQALESATKADHVLPNTECKKRFPNLQPEMVNKLVTPHVVVPPIKVNMRVDANIKEICERAVHMSSAMSSVRNPLPQIPDPGPQPELGAKPPVLETPPCFAPPKQPPPVPQKPICDKIKHDCKQRGRCPGHPEDDCPSGLWACIKRWFLSLIGANKKKKKGRSKSAPSGKTSKAAIVTAEVAKSASTTAINLSSSAGVTEVAADQAVSAGEEVAAAALNRRPPPPHSVKVGSYEGKGNFEGKTCVQTMLRVPKDPGPPEKYCPPESEKCREHPFCQKIRLPCCDPVRCPPNCDAFKTRSPCRKVEAPKPSFSECQHDDIPKLRLTECAIQEMKKEVKVDPRPPAEPFMPPPKLPAGVKLKPVQNAIAPVLVEPYESEIVKLPPLEMTGDCKPKESTLCGEEKFKCDDRLDCGPIIVPCPEPHPVELPQCVPFEEEVERGCQDPCSTKVVYKTLCPQIKGPCDKDEIPKPKREKTPGECKKLPACKKGNNQGNNQGKLASTGLMKSAMMDPLFGNHEAIRFLSHSSVVEIVIPTRTKNEVERFSSLIKSRRVKQMGSPLIDNVVKRFDSRKPIPSDFIVPRTKMPPPIGVIPHFPEPRPLGSCKYDICEYISEASKKSEVNEMSDKLEVRKMVERVAREQSGAYNVDEVAGRLSEPKKEKYVPRFRDQHEAFKKSVAKSNISFHRRIVPMRPRYASSLASVGDYNPALLLQQSINSSGVRYKSDFKSRNSSKSSKRKMMEEEKAQENEEETEMEEKSNEVAELIKLAVTEEKETDRSSGFVEMQIKEKKRRKPKDLKTAGRSPYESDLLTNLTQKPEGKVKQKEDKGRQEKLVSEIKSLSTDSERYQPYAQAIVGRVGQVSTESGSKPAKIQAKDWTNNPDCPEPCKKEKEPKKKKKNICDTVPRLSADLEEDVEVEENPCDNARPHPDACKKPGKPCDKPKKCCITNPWNVPKVCFSTNTEKKSEAPCSDPTTAKKEEKRDKTVSVEEDKRWELKKPGPVCEDKDKDKK